MVAGADLRHRVVAKPHRARTTVAMAHQPAHSPSQMRRPALPGSICGEDVPPKRRRICEGPELFAQDIKNDGGRLERRYQLAIRFQPAYGIRLNHYSLTII